jgi:DNA primase
MNETEQIKERLNVADLISEYLKLERAGGNLKGLCPFHNEKTPSFMVNPEKNFWYCFGCQKGGDIFTFLQEIEGLEFREALERLAERAGVELPKFQRQDWKAAKSRKQRLGEILELATVFFEKQLQASKKGRKIQEYLKNRAISEESQEQFRLGYAPEGWSFLLDFLKSRGYLPEDIAQTGLLVENSQRGNSADRFYDRFRDRIMFPVLDLSGEVVGYSARVAPGGDEQSAKYINTPQSDFYDKSKLLYGLYQGRTEIKKQDFVVVVEGNMDVIASFEAGFSNAVAVSGTALTEEQLEVIARYTNNVKLCFDLDEAGKKASLRSIQTCLKKEMEVEMILLPSEVKDVSDLVQKDPKLWKESIEGAYPVMEYFFQEAFGRHSLKEGGAGEMVKNKKAIARELLNVIKDIADPLEKNYWLKKLALKLEVEEQVLLEILEKFELKKQRESVRIKQREPVSSQEHSQSISGLSRQEQIEELLLGLLTAHYSQLKKEVETISPEEFTEKNRELLVKLTQGGDFSQDAQLNSLAARFQFSYDKSRGFSEREIAPQEEFAQLKGQLDKERRRQDLEQVNQAIKRAEEAGNEEEVQKLLERFSQLSNQ